MHLLSLSLSESAKPPPTPLNTHTHTHTHAHAHAHTHTHTLEWRYSSEKGSAAPFKMSGEHSWVIWIQSPRVCDIHPLPMITDVCMCVHLAKLILLAPLRILGSEGETLWGFKCDSRKTCQKWSETDRFPMLSSALIKIFFQNSSRLLNSNPLENQKCFSCNQGQGNCGSWEFAWSEALIYRECS